MGKVRRIARQEGVPLPLLRGLIRQESRNDPNARSPAGAVGRTQLMPATARSLGVDPYNDTENVRGGARYLRQQLDRFGGDRRKALAAYNAGPGAVEKYGGVPPFPETQNYVRSILRSAGAAGGRATGAGAVSPDNTTYTPGRVDLRRVMGFDKAGFEQATQRAKVGAFLASRGRGGGALFSSGLLTAGQQPDPADFTTTRLTSRLIPGSKSGPAAPPEFHWKGDGSKIAAPIHDGGGYARTEGLGSSAKAFAAGYGIRAGSEKRPQQLTASGNVSDHYEGNRIAYAVDFPTVGKRGDRLARGFARRYGLPYRKGQIVNGNIQVGKRRYRVQLIWGTSDHRDHVHIGFKRL